MTDVARDHLLEPLPLFVVEHPPRFLTQDPALAGVEHDEPDPAEIARVAPAPALAAPVGLTSPFVQQRPGIGLGFHACEDPALLELVRGEVAEVLVDPVARER